MILSKTKSEEISNMNDEMTLNEINVLVYPPKIS